MQLGVSRDVSSLHDRLDVNIRKSGSPTAAGNISLRRYLQHHGLLAAEGFGVIDPKLSFAESVQKFLMAAEAVLQHHLEVVVSGKEWEPIPIDWGGYK